MKKYLVLLLMLSVVLCFGSYSSLTTRVAPYATLDTLTDASSAVDTDLAAATGYNTAIPTGSIDLPQTARADSGSRSAYANLVSLILNAVTAADGDTLTQKLYGVTVDGPPQLIASIAWTIGTARADGTTATYLWADTAVVTSTHIKTLVVADGGGSNRVCSVTLDCTGYRYLYSLITAQTGDPTLITVLYRYF